MMLKRTLRVFITIILTLALTTGLVLAMTEDANAATVSMKTIPATSAKADSRVVNAFVELGFIQQELRLCRCIQRSRSCHPSKDEKQDEYTSRDGSFCFQTAEWCR